MRIRLWHREGEPLDAFEVLGISRQADQQQVRQAYHALAKACHPDQFSDGERQKKAQEEMIRLNLAYEEALKLTAGRPLNPRTVTPVQAKESAKHLLSQDRPEAALFQLSRAEEKDGEWYYLQGLILMKMKQYASAHQSFREAVRRCPDNNDYHAGVLDAAIAVRKHQKLPYRIADWADGMLHSRKKR